MTALARAGIAGGTGQVVTFGESMVLLHPLDPESDITSMDGLALRVAGADSNFAIAMTRLGWRALWMSAVSEDPLGDLVLNTIGAEGVDVSGVRRDSRHPTGVFFKFRQEGKTSVVYYRRGSAASHFQPEWLTQDLFEEAALLHVNGVTCALSDWCAASVGRAIALARQAGVPVSLDLNLRLQLWSVEKARHTLQPLVAQVDYLLATSEELLAFADRNTLGEALQAITAAGPKIVAVKRGPLGAMATWRGEMIEHPGFVPSAVVDEVGAGDGFDAGFISALLRGSNVADALRQGNLVGAAAVTVPDDVSGYPTSEQLKRLIEMWPERQVAPSG